MAGPIKMARRQTMRDQGYVMVSKLMRAPEVRRRFECVSAIGRYWVPPVHAAAYLAALAEVHAARNAAEEAVRLAFKNWRCACGGTERNGCCSNEDCNLEVCANCGVDAPGDWCDLIAGKE